MDKINILWVDDEIDLLRPHILFLKGKGYSISEVNNGNDALSMIDEEDFDIIFLDENMPGISGIETLNEIKLKKPQIPVVMITKSEEESIMEDAIGGKISDYLIKPVNPNQILLALKKNLDLKRLVEEKTTSGYMQEFRKISVTIDECRSCSDWSNVYKKLIYWDIEIQNGGDESMEEILATQKTDANRLFSKFVDQNYIDWIGGDEDAPLMSHQLIRERILPEITDSNVVFFVLIDNLRLDQWELLKPVVSQYFKIDKEEIFYSILPTTTQYARNALFAGLLPNEIEKKYPSLWTNDGEGETSLNAHEEELLANQFKRLGKDIKTSYTKITNLNAGKRMVDNISNMMNNKFNVIVYNFVDMLSHARTEMEIIKELASDEAAYRSLTLSWFEHSPLADAIKEISALGAKLIISTDHGTVRVKNPIKVTGDKHTNANLRFKGGRSLGYDSDAVFEIKEPGKAGLPMLNVNTTYIFAKENDYMIYPNNYNQYSNMFRNSFQHGGLSMEEVLIPFTVLSPK
ncbi:MAG: PglZ domain-containing protein [Flavobacteriales bacterium]|nr:PglZ domain-containing protein [Flavobacteriales bacterium]